jgi:endo-1,4-beta-D-glucanase Y
MDNLALQLIDEEVQEGFKIDNDNMAEWALKKISEESAETQRYINVCQTMINEYQLKLNKAKEQLESKTSYLKGQLQQYFETVPHKETKTQEQYKLPSGTLKLKKASTEFIRDEKVLGEFLKSNNYKGFYDEVIKPKWSELKKTIAVQDGKVIDTDTGMIVEGVTVEEKPAVFEVDI